MHKDMQQNNDIQYNSNLGVTIKPTGPKRKILGNYVINYWATM